ncbi:hypothetical protein [Sinimarinibacterium sp. NLF-5-8]|uniref:ribbon-helix-helix domain-containing protein n=1 Tax=Sinimarinibacterium sp. NLF-5-8 TaxID=2698684 RepID=UPI00137B99A0|nr:hypothetical protein [Sinimarinibacterium sp. NLF-5-8]QHS09918.1 hypothetical protein GT972_06975 [Sinimarinibacterium sp. NLF-5-8]
MRTTVELTDDLHEQVRRRAQREGLSLARMLGSLVEQALRQPAGNPPVHQQSGRFQVIAPASHNAKVSSAAVQKVLDEEGIL